MSHSQLEKGNFLGLWKGIDESKEVYSTVMDLPTVNIDAITQKFARNNIFHIALYCIRVSCRKCLRFKYWCEFIDTDDLQRSASSYTCGSGFVWCFDNIYKNENLK